MSEEISRTRVATSSAPAEARLLPGSLHDFAAVRQSRREEMWRQEGRAEAHAAAAQLFDQAIDSLGEYRDSLVLTLADTAATLAADIAQVLIGKELAAGNYDIAAIVRESLTSANSSSGETTIRVHPEDAEALAEVRFRSGTSVQPDPSIRRGNVLIQTDQGELVRDIDERLATIRETLREAISPC